MLRDTKMFIAVANSLKAEQEPPWPWPHVFGDVFGSRAQIARRECRAAGPESVVLLTRLY